MLTLLLFSIALATDAFAVAIARGSCSEHHWNKALLLGLAFGLGQSIAAIIGWLVGSFLNGTFQTASNLIACGALVILGILMIKGAITHEDDVAVCQTPIGPLRALIGLLTATVIISLDCLAGGVALPLLGLPITIDILVIFIVSFLMSAVGYRVGSSAGMVLGKRAEIVGGFILIGIGLHILA